MPEHKGNGQMRSQPADTRAARGLANDWADVLDRLQQLRPAEPDGVVRERIWQRISARLDEPRPDAVIQYLQARRPPEPDRAALERVWQRTTRGIREQAPVVVPRPVPMLRWATAIATCALLLLGYANGIAAALPDSAFYPLKRAGEAVLWRLTFSPAALAHLALRLADERYVEAEGLVAVGAPPALVAQTLRDALTHLDATAGAARSLRSTAGAMVQRVQTWQVAADRWPEPYHTATTRVLDQWLREHPGLLSQLPALIPTLLPPGASTADPLQTSDLAPTATIPAVPDIPGQGTTLTTQTPSATATPSLPVVLTAAATLLVPTPTALTVTVPFPTISPLTPVPTSTLLPIPTLPLPTSTPIPLPTLLAPTPVPTLPLP